MMTIFPWFSCSTMRWVVDALDARFGKCVVGDQPDLPASVADRLLPLRAHGHRHQRDRHLLAGRQ